MSFNAAQLAQYKKVNAYAIKQLQDNMQTIAMLEEDLAESNVCDMDEEESLDLHANAMRTVAAFSTIYSVDEFEDELDDVTDALA